MIDFLPSGSTSTPSFRLKAGGPVGLLKRHRPLLERIASEKYDRDRGAAANLLHIADDDLRATQESEAMADGLG